MADKDREKEARLQLQMRAFRQREEHIKRMESSYMQACLRLCNDITAKQKKWEERNRPVQQPQRMAPPQKIVQPSGTLQPQIKALAKIDKSGIIVGHRPLLSRIPSHETSPRASGQGQSPGRPKARPRELLTWKAMEREALRKALLAFGMSRPDMVHLEMGRILRDVRHAVGDIEDASFLFLKQCLDSPAVEENDRAWMLKWIENSPSILAPKQQPPGEREKDQEGRRQQQLEADVAHRVGRWDLSKSLTAVRLWPKRFVLLEHLSEVVKLCKDRSTRPAVIEAIEGLRDATIPTDWWTKEADLALLYGVHRHGYGAYLTIKDDPELSSAFHPAATAKDPGAVGTGESGAAGWPDAFALSRRLKRLIEHLTRKKPQLLARKKPELWESLAAAVATSSADKTKLSKKALGQSLAGRAVAEGPGLPHGLLAAKDMPWPREGGGKGSGDSGKDARWTRKERQEVLRLLMKWGFLPAEPYTAHPRGNALRRQQTVDWAALLSKSSIPTVAKKTPDSAEVCVADMFQEMRDLRGGAGGGQEGARCLWRHHPPTCLCLLCFQLPRLLEASALARKGSDIVGATEAPQKEHRIMSLQSTGRLEERLEVLETLRRSLAVFGGDWHRLGLCRIRKSQQQLFPVWWKTGLHDKALAKGIVQHGFGSWEAIAADPGLPFQEEASKAQVAGQEPFAFPEERTIGMRLKSLDKLFKRHLTKKGYMGEGSASGSKKEKAKQGPSPFPPAGAPTSSQAAQDSEGNMASAKEGPDTAMAGPGPRKHSATGGVHKPTKKVKLSALSPDGAWAPSPEAAAAGGRGLDDEEGGSIRRLAHGGEAWRGGVVGGGRADGQGADKQGPGEGAGEEERGEEDEEEGREGQGLAEVGGHGVVEDEDEDGDGGDGTGGGHEDSSDEFNALAEAESDSEAGMVDGEGQEGDGQEEVEEEGEEEENGEDEERQRDEEEEEEEGVEGEDEEGEGVEDDNEKAEEDKELEEGDDLEGDAGEGEEDGEGEEGMEYEGTPEEDEGGEVGEGNVGEDYYKGAGRNGAHEVEPGDGDEEDMEGREDEEGGIEAAENAEESEGEESGGEDMVDRSGEGSEGGQERGGEDLQGWPEEGQAPRHGRAMAHYWEEPEDQPEEEPGEGEEEEEEQGWDDGEGSEGGVADAAYGVPGEQAEDGGEGEDEYEDGSEHEGENVADVMDEEDAWNDNGGI